MHPEIKEALEIDEIIDSIKAKKTLFLDTTKNTSFEEVIQKIKEFDAEIKPLEDKKLAIHNAFFEKHWTDFYELPETNKHQHEIERLTAENAMLKNILAKIGFSFKGISDLLASKDGKSPSIASIMIKLPKLLNNSEALEPLKEGIIILQNLKNFIK